KLPIQKNGDLGGVPVMGIVRRELIMPFQLSSICVKSNNRARVKIVTSAKVTVVVRPGIARSPIHQVQLWIVRAGVPRGRAAGLPRISRPSSEVRLARLRDCVEAPHALPSGRIIRVEKAGNTTLSSGHADYHFVLYSQGRACSGIASGGHVIVHLGLPNLAA